MSAINLGQMLAKIAGKTNQELVDEIPDYAEGTVDQTLGQGATPCIPPELANQLTEEELEQLKRYLLQQRSVRRRSNRQGRVPTKQAMQKQAVIKHENGKYVLYSKDGSKVLGRHATRMAAEKQERAIQASKHKRGK